MLPYILTDNSLTIVVDGKALTMESSNPSFNEAKRLLSEEKYDELPDLFDTPKAVERFAEGSIKVSDGEVSYKGEVIHNHVVGRILDFMREGLPYKPLTRFVEKLMENPSRRAVNKLYAFLEHKNMPLTPDGNFLAGPAPGLKNFWMFCAASVGIAQGGGAGKYMAQWMTYGDADINMLEFDPRR